jgi:hypothetical protein
VDIILVDETHSAVVYHTIPDRDNDVGADGEDSMPTFTIPPRTPSIDLLALHHKRASKRRSRASQFSLAPNGMVSSAHTGFTSFHTPASSSDGHEPHHSALSSPLSRSCAYVARRVVMRWEWEEEAVYVDVPDFDADNSTVHLG